MHRTILNIYSRLLLLVRLVFLCSSCHYLIIIVASCSATTAVSKDFCNFFYGKEDV